jgi:WD40 repeat protein
VLQIFLSYASGKRGVARTIKDRLTVAGHKVFLDDHPDTGIPPGNDWAAHLHSRLRASDVMVCLVSGAYGSSQWCNAEVGAAEVTGTVILPVIVEAGAHCDLLLRHQAVDYAADPEDAMARVLRQLARMDGANAGTGWADGRNPYPGLGSFDISEQRVFFGRRADIRAGTKDIRQLADAGGGALLLVGTSGVGKSSLMCAGILADFSRADGWLTPPRLQLIGSAHAASDPLDELAVLLAGYTSTTFGGTSTATDVRTALDSDRGLRAVTDDLRARAGGRANVLLCIDQFEQLLEMPEPARIRIGRLLADAADHRVVVLGTLRVEFLPAVSADPGLGLIPFEQRWIDPMSASDLRSAVTEPAKVAGLVFEDGLVERILSDAVDGEALPLLAFTLHELASEKARGQELTLARYEALEGVRGAVSQQAERALRQATSATGLSSESVVETLLALVDIDDGGRAKRRIAQLSEANADARVVFAQFVECRLVVVDARGDESARSYRVAHEVLFEAWEPLRAAIERRRAQLRIRTQVQHDATEWEANGRDKRYLWQADRLALVQQAAPGHDAIEVDGNAGEFYRASLRRVRGRRRSLIAVLSTLLLVVTGFAIAQTNAVRAENRSRNAADDARRLADSRATSIAVQSLLARAESNRNSDPVLSLRLALAAQKLRPSTDAVSGLLETLASSRLAETVVPAAQGLEYGTWSADGTRYAALSVNRITLWHVANRRSARAAGSITSHVAQSGNPAWSPDGTVLAVDGLGEFTLYSTGDLDSPRRVAGPIDVGTTGTSVTLDWQPRGHLFAAAALTDTTATIWNVSDTSSPTRVAHIPVRSRVALLQWAPDGRTLAVGDYNGEVRLWTMGKSANPVPVGPAMKVRADSPVRSIAWSPSGKAIAAVTEDPAVGVWDVSDARHPRASQRLATGQNTYLDRLAWSPDGVMLAASGDLQVLVWNVRNPPVPSTQPSPPERLNRNVTAMSWGGQGHILTTVVGGAMLRWYLDPEVTQQAVGTLSPARRRQIDGIAWSPTAPILATVTDDGSVTLMTDRGQALSRFYPESPRTIGQDSSVAWSPNGQLLLVTTQRHTYMYDISDPRRPYRVARTFDPAPGDGFPVHWPTGRNVMSFDGITGVDLFDMSNTLAPKRVGTVPGYQVLSWTTDGRDAILRSEDEIAVFDLHDPARPQKLYPWRLDPAPFGVFPAPRGTVMATTGPSSWLYETSDPARPRALGNALLGEQDPGSGAAWSPDGEFLAVVTDSALLSIRHAADPADPPLLYGPVATAGDVSRLDPQAAVLPYIAWSDDEAVFATAALGRVLLWRIDGLLALRKNAVARACDASGGGLPRDEWDKYVQLQYPGPSCP